MARKSYVKADEIQVKGNKIFSPVRQKWLPLTPEERVRQEYLRVLPHRNMAMSPIKWRKRWMLPAGAAPRPGLIL
jgi:hypothetical protein